jgi:hypothetical protein
LYQNDTWYILLDGLAINSGGRPYFVKGTGKKLTMDEVEESIPESEKEIIRKAEEGLNPMVLNAIKEAKQIDGKPDISATSTEGASGLQKEELIEAEEKI